MKVRSKDEILNSMIDNFSLPYPVYEGTITHAIFSTVANAIAREYSIKDEEEKQIFLIDSRNEFLDKRAWEFGYDRKNGEFASGELTFEGTQGIVIPIGLKLKCNGIDFEVSESGQINDEGEGNAYVICTQLGNKGNIKAGTEFICDDMDFNKIYNANDLVGGIDIESDEDFNTRFFHTQRHKGTSGNEEHYEEWAKEVDGVTDAKATGLKNGNGTVEIVIAGKNNVVDELIINKVKEHIDITRPIGCKTTIKSMSDYSINITARIKTNSDIKSEFTYLANNYLNTCKENIVYSKLYSILANMSNVIDVLDFLVNDSKNNIKITTEQKAKVGILKIEVVD
ncbi:baseplate J/gp47 family protein [Peptostreptococcus canis]|uniref:Baseplate J/gp47 family protein n=1 Tax=Peptostreptococcus canis TaxID=1159213 RepID=A0ABR6TME8_9FIRM|nr:baseplate J/gp47 family protein [Peptostreptococcus canis]MBC2576587.1 baseplate J/gp47 family protein [Peptostreptococcus canis]MBP1998774.1 putative phage protein gp47/JayE [Peptostreptococcus canis]